MNRFEQFKITRDLLPAGLSYEDLINQPNPVRTRDIEAALDPLIPRDCGHPLIRIGGSRDGGYLLPDDLDGIEACFSPGVNNTKKFEDQLAATYGIKSFMCDFTSDPKDFQTPLIAGLQQFEKKWLDVTEEANNIDINQWVADNSSLSSDSILQIDVEGAEYRNLLYASEKTLSRFRIIVIEFHSLHLLIESIFLRAIFNPVIQKLAKHFVCCHVHANNCCGTTRYGDEWEVPKVLEVTYLRNDRVRATNSKLVIPHPKDCINVGKKPPIRLHGPWLRHADPTNSELMHLRQSVQWMQSQLAASYKIQQDLQKQLNDCGRLNREQLQSRFENLQNIALGKEASQSSLSTHSTSEGANGAINGIKTGRFGIHTSLETNPWWMVDLKEIFELHGIVIYNRLDSCAERSDNLMLNVSSDGLNWERVYSHTGKPTFGGYISEGCCTPLAIDPKLKPARYVRIESPGRNILHLDEIEIYGRKSSC